MNDTGILPLGERIRCDLETRIVSGAWPPGHRIPSEHALMAEYSCSRMTMHKVLSGMAATGLIVRRRRVGSIVAAPRGDRSILEIQDFATEAARLGRVYRHEILSRKVAGLPAAKAETLELRAGSRVVRLRCLHRMNGIPNAYEDRLISLAAVPAAESADFKRVPPGTWLLQNVPWTEAEHAIRARNATQSLGRLLQLKPNAACLVLKRRTWHQGVLVTEVTITYPGDRHWFKGRFSPTAGVGKAGGGKA
jgi:GntR family transcriptional regulator, histidine utilization repressor